MSTIRLYQPLLCGSRIYMGSLWIWMRSCLDHYSSIEAASTRCFLRGTQEEFVSVNPQAATSFAMDPSAFQSDDPEKSKLMRENAVLKLIIDIQHSNPLVVNKYIIADDATLIKLVQLLCNATEVHIDADDIQCGCTTKNTYRKVHAIFVVVNGETKNLKYDFSDVMYTLKELHISTKFVW